jgi:hypothetical protein
VTCGNRAISATGLVQLGSDDLLLLGWIKVLETQLVEARLDWDVFGGQVSFWHFLTQFCDAFLAGNLLLPFLRASC